MTVKVQVGDNEILTNLKGKRLLSNPLLNKETAFNAQERNELGLLGLLPSQVESMDMQIKRAYGAFQAKDSDLEKHIFLRALQDRNEVLFYRLLFEHTIEMMPIIYTPVVGQACEMFSHIYRKHRGLFISYDDKDRIDEILANCELKNVKVIVVTDGQRILGLGDQGAGGMGIPIGKLSLYTLCGGIDPSNTLPIVLDVGTNNQDRLNDPLYFGWRHERISDQEYYDFLEKFVEAVMRAWPDVLLQWEDFANPHARPILEKYGNRLCTFNDDIQGTAAVAVSALLAAVSAVGAQMKDQKVVMFGAGSAGMGIANLIAAEMIAQGLSEAEAAARIYLVDRPGLLHSKIDDIQPAQKRFQKDFEKIKANWKVQSENINLEEVVKNCGATVLIGTSSQPGAFSQSVVQAMSASCAHPVILPLSNPTSKCEAKPQDVLEWSQGKALVATGSPFDPVTIDGQLHTIGQCNNCYIFPGMGLAVVASGMNRVTDSMFLQAARALAKEAPAIKNKYDSLFPPLDKIRSVSEKIAIAVIKEAIALGMVKNLNVDDVEAKVKQTMWEPVYKTIKYKPE